MKTVVALVAVMLLSTGTAFASGSKYQPPKDPTTSSRSDSRSNADADAKARADADSSSKSNADSTSNASNDNSGNTDVNVTGGSTTYTEKRRPVNTAYAAPLVAGDDTCMGSTSAGGMGITLGFSFATTWKDNDCVVRKDARFLQNAQRQDIALSLMCSKPSVLAAVKRAGSDAEKIACGLEVAPVVVPTPKKPEMYLGERG